MLLNCKSIKIVLNVLFYGRSIFCVGVVDPAMLYYLSGSQIIIIISFLFNVSM